MSTWASIVIAGVIIIAVLWFVTRDELLARRVNKMEEERKMMRSLLSHSLHTPLASIKWHVEMLLGEKFGKMRIAQHEILHKIIKSIDEAFPVLDKFMDLSNVELMEKVKQPTTVRLQDALGHVLSHHLSMVDDKKISLNIPKNKNRILVFMDLFALHSILEIVFSNAVFYTEKKGSISVKFEDENGHVRVTIKDTGIGISDEGKKAIFDRLYRSDKARMMHAKGSGMGLYLAKQLLEGSNGSLTFTSDEGKGSVFTVLLPKAS